MKCSITICTFSESHPAGLVEAQSTFASFFALIRTGLVGFSSSLGNFLVPLTERTARIIRVFVSAPNEMAAARDAVRRVADDINRLHTATEGFRLEILSWDRDAFPDVGTQAQLVIDRQIADYDLFIGILGTKFGTPTLSSASGTEHEFKNAFHRYLLDPRSVIIAFYFHNATVRVLDIDAEQLRLVQEFRRDISARGVLWSKFDTFDDFRSLVREHLVMQARELIARSVYSPAPPPLAGTNAWRPLEDWITTANRISPQWCSSREITLSPPFQFRLRGTIRSSSPYFRFGFKLTGRNGSLFGDGSIQTSDNNLVVHVGKNKDRQKLFLTVYRNGIRLGEDQDVLDCPDTTTAALQLEVDAHGLLSFTIDDRLVFSTYLLRDGHERLFCLAWGDQDDFEVRFEHVEIYSFVSAP